MARWDSLFGGQSTARSIEEAAKQEKERKAEKDERDAEKAEKKKKKKEKEAALALAMQENLEAVNDQDERIHEVQGLEPRFVGLIIGKAGETIKSFKKNTGCSIEIDQNLPEGLPRVIIFRGTRKQIAAARRQVEALLQKTKDEERSRDSSGVPIPGHFEPGMSKELLKSIPHAARESLITRGVLPGNAGDGPARGSLTGEGVDSSQWRRENNLRPNQRQQKKNREDGPAAFGSLTSMTELTLGRPGWLQSKGKSEDELQSHKPDAYRRSLMLAIRRKLLRGRAYEATPGLMTLTTMPRALAESSVVVKDEKASSTGSPNAWTH